LHPDQSQSSSYTASACAAPVARSSAAIPAMKKRVIVVSGLSLAVFARRILCWQDEAISHTVAVTWLLCNRRCSVEHSATVYSSARLQLLVPRLGYGREHTAISIFAYSPLHTLPMLPSAQAEHRLGRSFSLEVHPTPIKRNACRPRPCKCRGKITARSHEQPVTFLP
jgi:hypothetical protein